MTKLLDQTGLAYFWGKIKAALALKKDKGATHAYTTAASAAKAWMRIANAKWSQIEAGKPLHLQFMLWASSAAAGVAYYQSWFVDVEVHGSQCGARIMGNYAAPFSQLRVLYENTAASVNTSTRPAIDIYLNYVLTGGVVLGVEEIYNSGWEFVADGQLSASTVPTGYENRAVAPFATGVGACSLADYATYPRLQYSNISANTTLAVNTTYAMRVLNCTGTITLTIPTANSNQGWFLIKNNGSGVITLHPTSASVYIDNVSADITLQPGEYMQIACQASGKYSIIRDGRWKSSKAENSAVVHLAGAEDITGRKTFTDTQYLKNHLVFIVPELTKGTPPAEDVFRRFSFFDVNGTGTENNRIGMYEVRVQSDGSSDVSLYAYKFNGTVAQHARISVHYNLDGTNYATAPTPSNPADDSTKIATTAWVRDATGNTALLAAGINGILPVAQGGTGIGSTAIAAENATDFNSYRTTGTFHVRWNSATSNAPDPVSSGAKDGVLLVWTIGGADDVTANSRLFQVVLGAGTGSYTPALFIRRGRADNSSWGSWHKATLTVV